MSAVGWIQALPGWAVIWLVTLALTSLYCYLRLWNTEKELLEKKREQAEWRKYFQEEWELYPATDDFLGHLRYCLAKLVEYRDEKIRDGRFQPKGPGKGVHLHQVVLDLVLERKHLKREVEQSQDAQRLEKMETALYQIGVHALPELRGSLKGIERIEEILKTVPRG